MKCLNMISLISNRVRIRVWNPNRLDDLEIKGGIAALRAIRWHIAHRQIERFLWDYYDKYEWKAL